jgi:hypothetical protein
VKQRSLVLVSLVSILLYASAVSASASGQVSLAKARSLIGTLYFNEAQAYQVSSSAGWKYDYAHNYPGVSTKAAFMKCAATRSDKGFSVTPNLSNIAVVKGWKIPQGIGTHLGGTVPKGVTFVVHETESLPGYSSAKTTAHVTILNGKAYYYNEPCGVASATTTTVPNENAGSSNFSRGYPLPSQVDAALVKLFKSQGRTVTYHTCSYFAPNLGPFTIAVSKSMGSGTTTSRERDTQTGHSVGRTTRVGSLLSTSEAIFECCQEQVKRNWG